MQSGRFCVCFGGSKEQLSDRKTCPVLSGIVYPGWRQSRKNDDGKMDVMQMDAFAEIKNYAGRVCIVHGTKDKIVDVSYAKRAAEAYKSTMPIGMQDSKRVQLHFIDGGGHMFSKKHDVIAMKLLKEFAAKHEWFSSDTIWTNLHL